MSRLDSFIARMQAQRDCLNFLKPKIDALPGPDHDNIGPGFRTGVGLGARKSGGDNVGHQRDSACTSEPPACERLRKLSGKPTILA